VFRAGTEVPALRCTLPQVAVRPRARRRGLRQTLAEAGERRCPRRVSVGRSRSVFDEAALSEIRNRSCECPRGPHRVCSCWPAHRSERARKLRARRSPPARRTAEAARERKTHNKESDDTSRGVRVLPALASGRSYTSVYLTNAIHSQGFSPSQRFDLARALRPYFMPHTPLGFLVSRAFPSWPAVAPLGARYPRAVSVSSGRYRASSTMTPTPTLHDLVLIFPSPGQFRRVCSAPRTVLQTSARLPRHRSATVRVRAAWTAEWG